MRFTNDFVQRVLEASNIVDFIGEVTQLKPSSGGFMGRCPFPDHAEKTPSFSVSETKQVYHCFGCQKSGNLFSFLRDYHGMNFPEAVEFLADRARIELPKMDSASLSEDERRNQLRKQILHANKIALEFFEAQLQTAPSSNEAERPVRAYIDKRKLSPEIVKQFRLGYSPSGWDGLAQYLARKSVPMDIAEQAGLVRRRREGTGHYDLFRDRLMFPIHKISGDVIGFGGRILEQGEPKYLNSPDSPVFSKGRTLYGLDQTARYIRAKDLLVIVEGYMDLLALFQAGIQSVAATLGTALTADHAHLLSKLTRNVVVLFDGDQAGQNAAEKSLPILLQAGLRPKGLVLPDELDPDEFIQERGAELLVEEIQRAPDLFNLVVHQWTLNFRGATTEKAAILERCEPLFRAMTDARLRDLYVTDLSQRIQMSPQQIKQFYASGGTRPEPQQRRDFKPILSSAPMPPSEQNRGQVSSMDEKNSTTWNVKAAPRAERILLSLALKNRANLELVLHEKLIDRLSHPEMRQIFQWIGESYRQEPAKFDRLASLLTSRIDDPSIVFENGLMSAPGSEAVEGEFEANLLRDCVKRVQSDSLKLEIETLRQELKISPTREGMEKLIQLQKDRLALTTNFTSKDAE